jgi:ribosomal protein S18 acetylase RimI-like enzyme
MDCSIRAMRQTDKDDILEMMRVFYTSAAVHTNGSEEIYLSDFNNCINSNPYLEGFIIEISNKTAGYLMVAKSFSTEFGKPCIWIEDIYLKEGYRGLRLGKVAIDYVIDRFPEAVIRLEAEEDNERAVKLYKNCGFEALPYLELIKR